jgi:hypothetical protein
LIVDMICMINATVGVKRTYRRHCQNVEMTLSDVDHKIQALLKRRIVAILTLLYHFRAQWGA